MGKDEDSAAELQDTLDTTDQLHTDISRLKRLGILTADEGRKADQHVDDVADALNEKLPDDK